MTKKIAAKDATSIHSFRLDPISKKWEVDPALNERYKWIKKYLDLPEKYNPRLVEIIKRESSKGKKMLYCRNINCIYLIHGSANHWSHPYYDTKDQMMNFLQWDGISRIVVPYYPIGRIDDGIKEAVCGQCWRGESGTYYDFDLVENEEVVSKNKVPSWQRSENSDFYKLQKKGKK